MCQKMSQIIDRLDFIKIKKKQKTSGLKKIITRELKGKPVTGEKIM